MATPAFVTSKEDLEWNNQEEETFVRALQTLPEKSPCTVRLFDRNGYYTVHGTDAEFVADNVFQNRAILRESKKRKMAYAVLNSANYVTTLRDLLTRLHYRVEVLERNGSRTGGEWQVRKRASPGDLGEFEEQLYGNAEDQNVIAAAYSSLGSALCAFRLISAGSKRVGGASNAQSNVRITCVQVDMEKREFRIAEFDDDRDSLVNLETCLLQFGAREALCTAQDTVGRDNVAGVTSSEFDRTSVGRLLERIGVCATVQRRAQFGRKEEEAVSDLRSLLRSTRNLDASHQPADLQRLSSEEGQAALTCVSALISYLRLTADSSNLHTYTVCTTRLTSFMRLDSAALNALDLFPSARNTVHVTDAAASQRSASASLYSLFATHCRTRQAQRLLACWIRQPLTDVNRISERQCIVAAFVRDTVSREAVQKRVADLPDLGWIARRLERRKATLTDAYKLYDGVGALDILLDSLGNLAAEEDVVGGAVLRDCVLTPLRKVCERDSDGLKLLREGIQKLLDVDLARRCGEYRIRSDRDIDERLFLCAQRLDSARRAVEAEFQKVKRAVSEVHEELEEVTLERSDDGRGYLMKVTKSREKFLREAERKRDTGVEIYATQANSVHFRTPRFVKLNAEFVAANKEHEEAQSEAADSLLDFAAQFRDALIRANELVASVDVLAAFATVACSDDNVAIPPYCRPAILPMDHESPRQLHFSDLRHACVERFASTMLSSASSATSFGFIANDVHLATGEGGKSFFVITGPNMGGKSTYMRSAGLAVILAQIGSFVPASTARVSICDAVHCRIGSQDVQSRGVSTFYAEMLDAGEILRCATRHSLVLVDELGRGTSTADGTALAEAIAVFLLERIGALTLFATHIFELTALERRFPQVRNVHVAAHIERERGSHGNEKAPLRMVLLYKVEDGPADGSFGIQCARLAELPESVVSVAEKKAAELALFNELNALSWRQDAAMDTDENQPRDAHTSKQTIQLSSKQRETFRLFGKDAENSQDASMRAECVKIAHEFCSRQFESRAQAVDFIRAVQNPLFRDLFPVVDA